MCVSDMIEKETKTKLPTDGQLADYNIERISHNKRKQLVVHMRGRDEPIVDARVIRCFPWSFPDSYISICDKDGKEIVLVKTLEELEPTSKKVIKEELRDKVFNPKIRHIVDYKSKFGVTSITAETDRGKVRFQIRSRDNIRVLSPTRALFQDADGNIYELTDLNALDPASRNRLEEYF
jgi:hypothetical protein